MYQNVIVSAGQYNIVIYGIMYTSIHFKITY